MGYTAELGIGGLPVGVGDEWLGKELGGLGALTGVRRSLQARGLRDGLSVTVSIGVFPKLWGGVRHTQINYSLGAEPGAREGEGGVGAAGGPTPHVGLRLPPGLHRQVLRRLHQHREGQQLALGGGRLVGGHRQASWPTP